MLKTIIALFLLVLAGCRGNFEYDPETFSLGPVTKIFLMKNPLADPDGDGLSTGKELKETKTSPLMRDTDCDGLSDASDPEPFFPALAKDYETWMRHWLKVARETGIPVPEEEVFLRPDFDLDGDGMDNREEFENRTSPLAAPGEALYFFEPACLERRTLDQDSFETDMGLLKKDPLWMGVSTFTMRIVSHKITAGYFSCEMKNGQAEIVSLDGQFFPLKRLLLRSKVCGTFVAGYGLPQTFRARLSEAFRDESEPGAIFVIPYDKSERKGLLPCRLKR